MTHSNLTYRNHRNVNGDRIWQGKVEELLTDDFCDFFIIHFKKQFTYSNNLILMFSTGDNSIS